MAKLLEVRNLTTRFRTERGAVMAVDDVSFEVDAGETLAIVGESGSGKSVTALSLMRLIPNPPGEIVAGSILFEGQDLLKLSDAEMQAVRGDRIAMIFQEPMTSLNPSLTVGLQVGEPVQLHRGASWKAAFAKAGELLSRVRIPDAKARVEAYPHQFSGGMRQRAMIAMALACQPKLIIADEPTTALDVTVQAQVLNLIRELQKRMGAAVLFITHDMGVVAEMCDEVAVMYAGRIVEQGNVFAIFKDAQHPYTKGLLRSLPRKGGAKKAELPTIEGVVPSLLNPPAHCRFADRCWKRKRLPETDQRRCFSEDPKLRPAGESFAACHFPVGGEQL